MCFLSLSSMHSKAQGNSCDCYRKSSKHNLKKSCAGCSIATGYTCIISNKISAGQKDLDNKTHIAASGLCGGVFFKF